MGFPNGKQYFNNSKPTEYWNNDENVLEFVQKLKEKLNLNNIDDWNRLSKHQINLHGGAGLARKYSLNQLVNG